MQVWVPSIYSQALFFLLICDWRFHHLQPLWVCFCSVATAASCFCFFISMCVWLFDSYCSLSKKLLVGIVGVSSSHQRIFCLFVSARHLSTLDHNRWWKTGCKPKPRASLWPQMLRAQFFPPFPLILCFLQHLKHLLCSVLCQPYLSL